ncbi:MAG: hut operon positive regulatory protein [Bacillota bacterium]|nr:MAG: hut operon positive regulatory protein [Bacillota bacterium]MBS3949893.1 HutP family protein [Peptococcaceae bacterium]
MVRTAFNLEDIDAERAAMLLAMSRSMAEEDHIKKSLLLVPGLRLAVSEAGGNSGQIQKKVNLNLLGTAIEKGVISRHPSQVHALLHAILEAKRGVMMDVPTDASLALKLVVVVRHEWLAVAIFGQSAMHVLTNHWRAGLGVMHFPKV